MAEFCSARSETIPPLPWTNFAPPFPERARQGEGAGRALRRSRSRPAPPRRPRRRQARRDAGLCTSCGRRPRPDDGSVCEPCRTARRTFDRQRYAGRRAAGLCVRCAQPTFGGSSRCSRCAARETERTSPECRSAVNRKRYAKRRARGVCTECGSHAAGATRRTPCAYRSNARASVRHLMSLWPPQITVIELETGDELGTFETEAEAAACLAFAGLHPDQVEICSNVSLMALCSPWALRHGGHPAGEPAPHVRAPMPSCPSPPSDPPAVPFAPISGSRRAKKRAASETW